MVQLTRHRFTVDEFYRMAETGILNEDDRLELIRGEIIEMAPIGSKHAGVVDRIAALLHRSISAEMAIIRVQSPVRMDDSSEPQPDVALLRPRPDFYASGHPLPSDIQLIIEVADTSLAYDRTVKLPLYAESGVPEVWIVDLVAGTVETHREPSRLGYKSAAVLARGDRISPLAFQGVTLLVNDILG